MQQHDHPDERREPTPQDEDSRRSQETAGDGDRHHPSPSVDQASSGIREEPRGGSCSTSPGYTGRVDFTAFVLSLAQSVLIDLGVTPHPESGRSERNLPQACNTIDILALIEEKTRGNLTPEESRLLEGTLYQLRMSFIEVKRRESTGG